MTGPASTFSGKTRARTRALRAVFACVIGCAAVLATLPARAAEDEKDFDEKIIDSILKGVGLRDDSANIEYRERSPLVIPPATTLPPPEKNAIANNPNWPVDPEIKRARAAKKRDDNNPYLTGDPILDEGRALRPDEIFRGRKAGAGVATASSDKDPLRPLTPRELGNKGSILGRMFSSDEETAPFTGEPPRASLTEPPRGYRTPSPTQPYGVGSSKAVSSKTRDNMSERVESKPY